MIPLLEGIRVLDFTTVVLGPFATQMLGDFGAEVIKIENLAGDIFRTVRPGRSADMGAGFINLNRNKRSLSINLKSTEGAAIIRELLKTADVLVHNMRDDTAERLGLSYHSVKDVNPEILYCSSAGYGQQGPYADEPAYDDIIQAASGIADMTKDAEGNPRYFPTILCDKISALYLANSILGGLVRRAKTGKGCKLEAPMFESMVSFLLTEQLAGQSFKPPLGDFGYERLSSPNRKPFRTQDGFISILPYSTQHWEAFLRLAEHGDETTLALVKDPVLRSKNIDSLYGIIAEITPSRSTAQWLAALREIDVPCSPINRLQDLLAHPQLAETEFFQEYTHPTEGALLGARSPINAEGLDQLSDSPAPQIGQDTLDIVRSLGIDDATLRTLSAKNILKAC